MHHRCFLQVPHAADGPAPRPAHCSSPAHHSPPPPKRPAQRVLLVEDGGEIYAVSNKCSHLGLPLQGKTAMFTAVVRLWFGLGCCWCLVPAADITSGCFAAGAHRSGRAFARTVPAVFAATPTPPLLHPP
jgi:hypothetical protein